jgi:hypothetical protein
MFKKTLVLITLAVLFQLYNAEEVANSVNNVTAVNSSLSELNAPVNNAARSMNVAPSPDDSQLTTQTATSSASSSLLVVLVSLIVVVCLISLIVATLFVMNRRYNLVERFRNMRASSKQNVEGGEEKKEGQTEDVESGAVKPVDQVDGKVEAVVTEQQETVNVTEEVKQETFVTPATTEEVKSEEPTVETPLLDNNGVSGEVQPKTE